MQTLGVTYLSSSDDSDPLLGIKCKKIDLGNSGISATKWNAFWKAWKLLIEL